MRVLAAVFFCFSFVFADVVVFVYHRFDDTRHPSTSISVKKLRQDLNYLQKNGYEVLSLKDLAKRLKNKTPLPKKGVAFSIDDAYKTFYTNALSVFKEFNYPFTLFVSTEAVNKKYKDFMTWQDLKEASKYGDIELHSYSHPHLANLSDQQIKADLKKDIELYKKHFKKPPTMFAYPYGEYEQRVKNIVKSMGFKAIFNQNMGAVSNKSDVYDLDRTAVGENTNIKYASNLKFLPINLSVERTNEKIKKIKINLDTQHKNLQMFLSGYEWKTITPKNGEFVLSKDLKLLFYRNRLIFKTKNNAFASMMIIKQKEQK